MSYRPKLQLHPPAHWQDFEILCLGLWKAIWGDSGAQRNGRQGQPQHGVDVFGQPSTGVGWAGVQCKGKNSFADQVLTKPEVTKEIKKAKKFIPRLSEYTIATTAPRDGQIQMHVRNVTKRLERGGWFRLSVCGWDDIEELLYEHEPPIARKFYPDVFGGEMAGFVRILLGHLSKPTSTPSNEAPSTGYATEGRSAIDKSTDSDNLTQTTRINTDVADVPRQQDGVRARDVGLALRTLSRLEDAFARHSEAHGSTSSDATMAAAIRKAVGGDRE